MRNDEVDYGEEEKFTVTQKQKIFLYLTPLQFSNHFKRFFNKAIYRKTELFDLCVNVSLSKVAKSLNKK